MTGSRSENRLRYPDGSVVGAYLIDPKWDMYSDVLTTDILIREAKAALRQAKQ